jgi:hypothetical protein
VIETPQKDGMENIFPKIFSYFICKARKQEEDYGDIFAIGDCPEMLIRILEFGETIKKRHN